MEWGKRLKFIRITLLVLQFWLTCCKTNQRYNSDLLQTYSDGSVCHNVIAEAKFNFTVDGSEIDKVEVQLTLTNVSLVESEFVYLKKVHYVSFSAVSFKSESESDSYVYNRGYVMGENLNFGFKRKNGPDLQWEKGHLRIYLNGESYLDVYLFCCFIWL
ncbi:UNVERIFIED_CONTAM: hypothetical protein PYX00_005339 [Menopon gallinae]|uniref:Lipoprotein n=1 Tax=Menopon gallinae TaxID=328185 RepID=A0AAW2HQX4_9NEOP